MSLKSFGWCLFQRSVKLKGKERCYFCRLWSVFLRVNPSEIVVWKAKDSHQFKDEMLRSQKASWTPGRILLEYGSAYDPPLAQGTDFFTAPNWVCIFLVFFTADQRIQAGMGLGCMGTGSTACTCVHIHMPVPVNHTGKKPQTPNLELWEGAACSYLLHWPVCRRWSGINT